MKTNWIHIAEIHLYPSSIAALVLLVSASTFAAPPVQTTPPIDLTAISGLGKSAAKQACVRPKGVKPGETPPPPVLPKPVFRHEPPADFLSCYDGVDYGNKFEKHVEYKDGKDSKFITGYVHTAPYIPHEGAINSYFMVHDKWDLKNALGNSPVEALGVYKNYVAPQLPGSPTLKMVSGKISSFGGPNDGGMTDSEKVVCGDTLGHDLNPNTQRYCAFRADFVVRNKNDWCGTEFTVTNPKNGKTTTCQWNEWGPNRKTKRMFDASNLVLKDIGVETDDEVLIAFSKPGCSGRHL